MKRTGRERATDWGGPIGCLRVTLSVVGDDLEPDEVTSVLGRAPSFAARKGDQIERGKRLVTQRTGVWLYRVPRSPRKGLKLERTIIGLLSRFPAPGAPWRTLARRFRLGLGCGLFLTSPNQGVELSPTVLQALEKRGLTLGLDIYASE